jgi:cytochrome P450 family 142 subfamily A polypeptide 1
MNVDVNYLDSAVWDPEVMDRFKWLRENDPVFWSQETNAWIVTKYDHVLEASKDQARFSSEEGVRPGNPVKLGLIDEGEPRHTQLRKLINRGFTPRMVKHWEEIFRGLCDEVLGEVGPKGECDFVHDIAVPLPLLLIAEMLGIRKADRQRFHQWSDNMIAGDGNFDRPEIMAKAAQAYIEYSQYITEIIEARRIEPREDLVSKLVAAKDEGLLETFDENVELFATGTDGDLELANDELIKLLVVLLVAGNETTRNSISGAMALLIEHPEVRQDLIEHPEKIPQAMEETIRLVSPVHSFGRTVMGDTELGGKSLAKGDTILLVYPSVNRDADAFPDPDRFDIDRRPHHLGFGIGPHFCLGANLARMEMRVAFEEILRRMPDMEYSNGGPVLKPSSLVRSCVEMCVRFTPERKAA